VLAAATLLELGYADVSALGGGTAAWRQESRPLEQGLAGVMRPPDDVVPAGPDRGYADMINYLRWEEKLGHKYAP
jgi:3-mercaptopyruvate sulfurtransferase SseA